MDRDLSEDDSVMELSFKAESPLTPPAELLERMSSCDHLLRGGTQQIFFPLLEAPGRPQQPSSWSLVLEQRFFSTVDHAQGLSLLRASVSRWHGEGMDQLRSLALPRPLPLRSVPSRAPLVTEEVAREAFLSFVNSKCCYGSAAAGDLIIRELKKQTLCRYRLETFSESRITEWTFEPFTNHSVDGPERGTSPRLWDINVQVPPMFQEDTRKFQVPHSSLVKECHKCHGHGRHKCRGCHGASMVRCSSCSGSKRKAKQPRRCQVCSGSGRRRCSTCSGRGNKTCTTCKGEKKLLHFIQLIIMWKNNLFEFVSEHQLNCPGELLAKAKGENLFKDENLMVYPIVDFPLQEISLASQRAIAKHNATLASRTRILQQRQTIELIPLTEVHYWYHGQTSVYYIYGTDHKPGSCPLRPGGGNKRAW
ncbi:protein SSUH2 homolog isoform X2 [Choloepus didactylus]|uniref:protein SSUH2 homolog isoform X2 n=1 Tax=Choloepus didactylus TaxID=27675 RepID=UPI0018A110A5|nr:protein SSUH2 homolog isoform X2 [Choloepus didactylus]